MKPETHLLSAIVIAGPLSIGQPLENTAWITLAAIIGVVFPDGPILLQVIADKIKKRPAFSTEQEGTLWFVLKDISHSPFLWLAILIAFFGTYLPGNQFQQLLFLVAGLGIALHWIIDAFTHCGDELKDTDQSLVFPAHSHKPGKIFKLSAWIGKLGLGWEYRHNYKIGEGFKTKRFERIVQVFFAILWLVFIAILMKELFIALYLFVGLFGCYVWSEVIMAISLKHTKTYPREEFLGMWMGGSVFLWPFLISYDYIMDFKQWKQA